MTTQQNRKEELTALIRAANIIANGERCFFYLNWAEVRAAVTSEMTLNTIHNGCAVPRTLVEDAIATLYELDCRNTETAEKIRETLQAQLDAL